MTPFLPFLSGLKAWLSGMKTCILAGFVTYASTRVEETSFCPWGCWERRPAQLCLDVGNTPTQANVLDLCRGSQQKSTRCGSKQITQKCNHCTLTLLYSCCVTRAFQDWASAIVFQRQNCVFKLHIELMNWLDCLWHPFFLFSGFFLFLLQLSLLRKRNKQFWKTQIKPYSLLT